MEEINGKVSIPGNYFLKMAKADYRDYRQALWREIYQNSIDAGAENIHVTWDKDERSITILDDGCGMDLDTLQNKLLALGGSKKEAGSTGAFGKAKELELFSWKEYMLHTHQYLLMGHGDDYTITETSDNLDGCNITLYIQEAEDFSYLTGFAKTVAEKIETSCKIFMGDDFLIECKFPKGEFVKSLEVGDIYVNNDIEATNYAKFRMNGIWMFDQYIGQDTPHITVELSANSIECMNSNRDGLKGNYLQDAAKYFQKLATDRKSALFPDKVEIRLHAKGTDGDKIEISDEDVEFIQERYGNLQREEFIKGVAQFYAANCQDIDHVLAKMRIKNNNIDLYDTRALKYFGFKWDTIHKFEKGKEKEATEFLDGSSQNANRAKTLLKMWGETIKQVLIDNQEYRTFTIGFNWDENQQAQLGKEDNEYHFYLNPNILDRFSLRNKKELARKLKSLAVHEVAHIYHEYHDEWFLEGMERVSESTWKSDKIYDRIAKIK